MILGSREGNQPNRSASLGNLYDKWHTRHPVERLLMSRFLRVFLSTVADLRPSTVLDVRCGEGYLTEIIASLTGSALVIGLDVDHGFLHEKAAARVDRLVTSRLPNLPFGDRSFDLVVLSEVLEHIEEPGYAIMEVARVCRNHAIVTVPLEPLWRLGNLLRLSYVRRLGNTPGHVQHFTTRILTRTLMPHFSRVIVRRVLPWLIAVCTGPKIGCLKPQGIEKTDLTVAWQPERGHDFQA